MFFTLILTEYKSLDLTYLNTMSKLMREKFTKTMLFYLCAADLLEFNKKYSIAATDQIQ